MEMDCAELVIRLQPPKGGGERIRTLIIIGGTYGGPH